MDWSLEDYLKLIAAVTAFLTVALPTFYVTVVRPLLAQIKELIVALRENTTATDTSAAAITNATPNTVNVVNVAPTASPDVPVGPTG